MTSYQESEASRRTGDGHDALGCLVPLIALTISLAIAFTLVSWLWSPESPADQGVEGASQQAPTTISLEELLSDLDLPADEPISTEAIFVVVRSLGWQAFGYPETYDLSSEQRAVHTFHRDGRHLQVTIHTHKTSARAEGVLDDVAPPQQAVQFDSRVVVISPVGDAAAERDVAAAAERLRRFRELLEHEDLAE